MARVCLIPRGFVAESEIVVIVSRPCEPRLDGKAKLFELRSDWHRMRRLKGHAMLRRPIGVVNVSSLAGHAPSS